MLRDGDLRFLVTNDRDRTVAFSRSDGAGGLAIVALNPDPERVATITIPMADARGIGVPVPDGMELRDVGPGQGAAATVHTVAGGQLSVTLPPLGATLLVPVAGADLAPPSAPTGLGAEQGAASLRWDPVADAVRYQVERASLPDGPTTMVGETGDTGFADPDAPPMAQVYLVRAIDAAGNVGRRPRSRSPPPCRRPPRVRRRLGRTTPPGATTPPGGGRPPGACRPRLRALAAGLGIACRGHDPGGPAALEAGLRGASCGSLASPT